MEKQYLKQIVVNGILTAGLLMASGQAYADDTAELKAQVQALQNRVNQLESELGNNPQAATTSTMPSYDQWVDPFTQMMLMREQMDRNMNQAFGDTGSFAPRVDMKQTDKQYLITMDIPGMDRDRINVEIKDGTLIISGERRSEIDHNKNNQYYRQERSFGSFMQAIPLPDDVKSSKIEAKYKDGVLTVTVGRLKKDEKRADTEKITVK